MLDGVSQHSTIKQSMLTYANTHKQIYQIQFSHVNAARKQKDLDVNVDFSFCLVLIVRLNCVLNLRKQNKFLSKHKLSPINLTWLSQVYGKMFDFPNC